MAVFFACFLPVLISQERQRVECRRRTSDTAWQTIIDEAGAQVVVDSIGLEFAIAKLYRGLDD